MELKVNSCTFADFIALRKAANTIAPTDMPYHSRGVFCSGKKTHKNEGLVEARANPLPVRGHLFLLTTQDAPGEKRRRGENRNLC